MRIFAIVLAILSFGYNSGFASGLKEFPSADPEFKSNIKTLVKDQKYQRALGETEKYLSLHRGKNEAEYTRGLIEKLQLQLGLHGYETGVKELKSAEWPKDPLALAIVQLNYTYALRRYYSSYRWEINKREEVVSGNQLELKKWTADQISLEIEKNFYAVWKLRSQLGAIDTNILADFFKKNTYPDGVRPTLRDAVSYLYAEHLSDSSLWSPSEASSVQFLKLTDLLVNPRPLSQKQMLSEAVHPMKKAAHVLNDLSVWHRANKRSSAELESQLQRVVHLKSHLSQSRHLGSLESYLQRLLVTSGDSDWKAKAYDELAKIIIEQEASRPEAFVEAKAILEKCLNRFESGLARKFCEHSLAQLEKPEFSLHSMTVDGLGKSSFQVQYKNLNRFFFNAYKIDIKKQVMEEGSGNLFPGHRQVKELVKTKPVATWEMTLRPTPDYRVHKALITPKLPGLGFYLITASSKKNPADQSDNFLKYVTLTTSKMVISYHQSSDGSKKVQVLDGNSGLPISKVSLQLVKLDYRKGNSKVGAGQTDERGSFKFSNPGNGYGTYVLLAEKDGDTSVVPNLGGFYPTSSEAKANSVLVYSDRSIYRPGQKIQFKALGYSGDRGTGSFSPKSIVGKDVVIKLFDQNSKVVAEVTKKANTFGTVSGEFLIPKGRALGRWRIHAKVGKSWGASNIKVEEYKRPTFEVALGKPSSPLRLNSPARIKGSAKYYFGLPVTEGSVKYMVSRRTVQPWWWSWCFSLFGTQVSRSSNQPEIIAAGLASLDKSGEFLVEFLPKAPESGDNPNLSYSYLVSADVTDIGGETRSMTNSYQVGRVAVTASIQREGGYLTSESKSKFSVSRMSLNGSPLSGVASWSLHKIVQPKQTRNISQEPLRAPPGSSKAQAKYIQPGDLKRPRWSAFQGWPAFVFHWPTGESIEAGSLQHDAMGLANLELGPRPSGFYRLVYRTKDKYGAEYSTTKDFYVAGRELNFPLVVGTDKQDYNPGDEAKIFIHSGFPDQKIHYRIVRNDKVLKAGQLKGRNNYIVLPVLERHRGGASIEASFVNDFQFVRVTHPIHVNWNNKKLHIEFVNFRDQLKPGEEESLEVKISRPEGQPKLAESAEVLAYMYDRSLDAFGQHNTPNPFSSYGQFTNFPYPSASNLASRSSSSLNGYSWYRVPSKPYLKADTFKFYSSYGIGGLGRRRETKGVGFFGSVKKYSTRAEVSSDLAASPQRNAILEESAMVEASDQRASGSVAKSLEARESRTDEKIQLRSSFAETAFFIPHANTSKDGKVSFKFQMPDSVTDWNIWVHAVTRSILSGQAKNTARSVKDLMVRPYLPRFLREADRASVKIVVNNASSSELKANLEVTIFDPRTNEPLMEAFGLKGKKWSRKISVKSNGSGSVEMPLKVPSRIGDVAFQVIAKAGNFSDGEQRVIPILPSRMHLLQSRFVTLRQNNPRSVEFKDMNSKIDPSLINKQLVLTLDAQLFYSVLTALPYLVNYPYQCTEQTLNRFVATSILTQVFRKYPSVAKMAKSLGKQRDSRIEEWNKDDPNRMLFLEESPWLNQSQGGAELELELAKVLDAKVARQTQEKAMSKLKSSQTSSGGFPWFPGGKPNPYITLLVVHGFSKAAEFGVSLNKNIVKKAWKYLHQELKSHVLKDHGLHFLVYMNYLASAFPDKSWLGGYYQPGERRRVLDYTFEKWTKLSPYLKAYLALTLHRSKRTKDAKLVFDSIMDSSKSSEDQGTFWAAEDRSWLWYNDSIESHAYILRALSEIQPKDSRREGLVQWLFLNKKLGHWKSTRATAEVLYSLVHYLEQENQLEIDEKIDVQTGSFQKSLDFKAESYSGKARQIVFKGKGFVPGEMSKVTFEKKDKALGFASATWHFSTEKLPEKGDGDFLAVDRNYYMRSTNSGKVILRPIGKGDKIKIGDEIEVQIGIRTKHPFEYVHLRDPRAAGFEPGVVTSGWEYDLGLRRYKEIRDSATNFFIEWLPQGQYTLKYRVRASTSGRFRVGPARIQSMYAPEFGGYSAGHMLTIQ